MTFFKTLLKYFSFIFLVLCIVFLVVLANLFLTGRTERAYNVIDPETIINFKGQEIKPFKLAQLYKPIIEKRSVDESPNLLWIYYEVIPSGFANTYDLIYYSVWEKEINPEYNSGILTSLFRMAYYGYPPFDIQYYQVSVDKESGRILKLLFETNLNENYNSAFKNDVIASFTYSGDNKYQLTHVSSSGSIISQEDGLTLLQIENQPVFGIVHWTHSSVLINGQNDTFEEDLPTELRLLTDRDYVIHKFSRKSQGDNKTEETIVDRIFLALVSAIFVYTVVNSLQTLIFGKKQNSPSNQIPVE